MLVRIAIFACLGGFLYGYDLGLMPGALSPIIDDFDLSTTSAEVVVGAAKFGAIFGTFLGGALMLFYGRRMAIALDSLFFVIGPAIMATSTGIFGVTLGRLIVGLGIGVSAVVVPAYLGEVAPAKLRGRMVETYEVLLCLGMLFAMLIDAALEHAPWNWRWMVGSPIVPALLLAFALYILPESPRWLVCKSKLDEALAVIHAVYTDSQLPLGTQTSTAEVEQELMELWSSVEKDKAAAKDRLRRSQESMTAHQALQLVDRQQPIQRGGRKWHRLKPSCRGGHILPMQHASLSSPSSLEEADVERNNSRDTNRWINQELAESQQRTGSNGCKDSSTDVLLISGLEQFSDLTIKTVFDGEATETFTELESMQSRASEKLDVSEALKDPTSPLYRSLSEIPDGLPKVRTKSDLHDSLDTTPQTGLRTPRKGSLRQCLSANVQIPCFSGKDMGKEKFWSVFWEMMLDIKAVAVGPERKAFEVSIWLAFFNQAMASSSVINYAPKLLERSGVHSRTVANLMTSTVITSKVICTVLQILGVLVGVALVDSAGRRPLLIWGSAGSAAALTLLFGGAYIGSTIFVILALCLFMFAFNASYAGVFWVLLSELFSMSSKSPAASAATAMLFTAGFLSDSLFWSLLDLCGASSFLIYAGIAGIGSVYSYLKVPETKGRTLAEVQALNTGSIRTEQELQATLSAVECQGSDMQASPTQSANLIGQLTSKESTHGIEASVISDEEHGRGLRGYKREELKGYIRFH